MIDETATGAWQLWDFNLFRTFALAGDSYLCHFGTNSYETIHEDSNTTVPAHNNDGAILVGQGLVTAAWYIYRGLIEFDTSTLGLSENVLGAAIVFCVQSDPAHNNTYPNSIHAVAAGSVHSPLVIADFGTMKDLDLSYGHVDLQKGRLLPTVQILELSEAAWPNIVKGGITRFVLRSGDDISHTAPPGLLAPKYGYYSIFGKNTAEAPKLIVRTM